MLEIDCKFPGGNIKVHDIKGDTVFVSPDLRDTMCSWFYWAFRVRHAAGRTLVFRFIADHPVGTRGPAISTDARQTWHWTTEPFDQDSFRVTVPCDADEIYLALAPVYTQLDWDRFVTDLTSQRQDSAVETGFIAKSRAGRDVEVLHAGACAATASRHVVITARHHCCEMVASRVMEGIVAEVTNGEDDSARWLRENVSFSFVPFADKDGVENGDQGKSRFPHDHNRDYGEGSIYPETAAIRKLIDAIAKRHGKLDIFIDLHCPWIRGDKNEFAYQVGRESPRTANLQATFGDIIESLADDGSLPYFRSDDVLFGESWNTAQNYSDGLAVTAWADQNPLVDFTTSFEIPYANCRDVTVTSDRARGLGRTIARSIARFFTR